jgi:hypothetical protein
MVRLAPHSGQLVCFPACRSSALNALPQTQTTRIIVSVSWEAVTSDILTYTKAQALRRTRLRAWHLRRYAKSRLVAKTWANRSRLDLVQGPLAQPRRRNSGLESTPVEIGASDSLSIPWVCQRPRQERGFSSHASRPMFVAGRRSRPDDGPTGTQSDYPPRGHSTSSCGGRPAGGPAEPIKDVAS